MIRGFGSDNFSGVLPEVFKALEEAAYGHQHSTTKKMFILKKPYRISKMFLEKISVYFSSITVQGQTYSAYLLSPIPITPLYVPKPPISMWTNVGAIEKQSGCKLLTVPTFDGKLTTGLIQNHMHGFGEQHHSQPKMISLTQCTELGTVYTPAELKEICDYAHAHRMYVHMDGARLSNAVAYLGCDPRDITSGSVSDVLSFGGTKNGMMFGEAVVFFQPGSRQRGTIYP